MHRSLKYFSLSTRRLLPIRSDTAHIYGAAPHQLGLHRSPCPTQTRRCLDSVAAIAARFPPRRLSTVATMATMPKVEPEPAVRAADVAGDGPAITDYSPTGAAYGAAARAAAVGGSAGTGTTVEGSRSGKRNANTETKARGFTSEIFKVGSPNTAMPLVHRGTLSCPLSAVRRPCEPHVFVLRKRGVAPRH